MKSGIFRLGLYLVKPPQRELPQHSCTCGIFVDKNMDSQFEERRFDGLQDTITTDFVELENDSSILQAGVQQQLVLAICSQQQVYCEKVVMSIGQVGCKKYEYQVEKIVQRQLVPNKPFGVSFTVFPLTYNLQLLLQITYQSSSSASKQ